MEAAAHALLELWHHTGDARDERRPPVSDSSAFLVPLERPRQPVSPLREAHNSSPGGERVATAAPEESARRGVDCGALLERLAGGDQSALATLYDATSRLVYGLALRILGDPADAEEVTLDVYTQAWRQVGRYDASRGDALTWLLTLTRSRAIDRLRSRAGSRKREQALDTAAELATEGPDPESQSAYAERARRVRGALSVLSPEQRQVIELAYFEGLTHVEIAERIAQPLGTAKSRIRLGMAKLRDALRPLDERWSM
jgi:RNA polymerase sigma-70 factor (ECF subfamily)